jgi:hypothetical protein
MTDRFSHVLGDGPRGSGRADTPKGASDEPEPWWYALIDRSEPQLWGWLCSQHTAGAARLWIEADDLGYRLRTSIPGIVERPSLPVTVQQAELVLELWPREHHRRMMTRSHRVVAVGDLKMA